MLCLPLPVPLLASELLLLYLMVLIACVTLRLPVTRCNALQIAATAPLSRFMVLLVP